MHESDPLRLTVPQALELAVEHHRAGRLNDARLLYQAILAKVPDHPDALHLLGLLAHQVGNPGDGLPLVTRAVQLAPETPAYMNSLGLLLRSMGFVHESHAAFRKATWLAENATAAQQQPLGSAPADD